MEEKSNEPVAAKEKEIQDWELDDALSCLEKAEKIKSDSKMMGMLKDKASQKLKNLKKICGDDMEEDDDEEEIKSIDDIRKKSNKMKEEQY